MPHRSAGARRWRPRLGRLLRRRATTPTPPAPRDPDLWRLAGEAEQAVERLRTEIHEARAAAPARPLAELLPLATRLHEARLEHAAAVLKAGGEVAPQLRRELELRERRARAGAPGDQRAHT